MRLNLRQIEAFRFVYQTGSMTMAGELMGVSQPAVSRLIADLEAEIALPLFERQRGRLRATADAAELFREVQRSFHGLDRIARVARDLRHRRTGDLRIATTLATSFFLLPAVIERFRRDWPDVRLSLHAAPSLEVLEEVALQHYDIGIAVVPPDSAGVHLTPLPVLDAVCLLPARHPLAARETITPEDLADEPLLMLADNSLTQRRIFRSLEEAGIEPRVMLESSFSAPICDLITRGIGLAILEPVTAWAYADEDTLIRPYAPAIPVALQGLHPASRPPNEPAAAFLALVGEALTQVPAGIRGRPA